MSVSVGNKIPDIAIVATSGLSTYLEAYKGKSVVLYFYPKDNTPGCTMESKAFRDANQEFAQANCVIFGISKDSMNSHESFKTKQCLPFELISDKDGTLCQLFEVLKQKSMFGRKYMGIERSTFLIDKHGILRREWRKVSVLGHVKEVLEAAKALN